MGVPRGSAAVRPTRQRPLLDAALASPMAAGLPRLLLLLLLLPSLGRSRQHQAIDLAAASPLDLLQVHDANSGYDAFVYVPPGKETQDMPLLLFLHGAGESGNNLDKLIDPGATTPLLDLKKGTASPGLSENFVVVAPQNPWGTSFAQNTDKLLTFLSYLMDSSASGLHLNPDKLYVTGHSMGGHGAIVLAAKSVGQALAFKAVVPVAPAGTLHADDPDFGNLLQIGVWAFHGENDIVISHSVSEHFIDDLRENGASESDARLTLIHNSPPPPGNHAQTGHGSTMPAYGDYDELWDWILSY